MTAIVNNPVVLEQTPKKLVIRLSHSVDIAVYLIGGLVLLGIAAVALAGSNLVWSFISGLLGFLCLFRGITSQTRTQYIFDKNQNQLTVNQDRARFNRCSLDNLTVITKQCSTNPVGGSIYYEVRFRAKSPNPSNQSSIHVPAITCSNRQEAHRLEDLIESYLSN
ncbi:MAG: hypothetical protein ACTS2F_30155 [Thainema sp.]